MDPHVSQLIDCCIGSKGSHYDIARVSFCVLRDHFRYKGEGEWEYKIPNSLVWAHDDNRREFEMAIRVNVCQMIMQRALYWQEASMSGDMSLRIDCQIRASKLLEICCKLSKDRFVQQVIKEARALFVNDV